MLIPFAFVAVGGGTVQAEILRLATYNVRNYVVADRLTDDGWRPAYPKPEKEKTALRAVIRAAQADILVLQEMGPPPYLEELRRDLLNEGLDYPFGLVLRGPDSERHVALLARRPPINVKRHETVAFSYAGRRELVKRGMLEATFATPAGELTVFALHLKSRLTEQSDDPESVQRRTAEALALRDIILRRHPFPAMARFVVLGDCNASRDSRAVQALQRRGTLQLAELIPARDSRGESWTYYYRTEDSYTRVDHILASVPLIPAVRGGAAQIVDLADWALASDHRLVVVELDLDRLEPLPAPDFPLSGR